MIQLIVVNAYICLLRYKYIQREKYKYVLKKLRGYQEQMVLIKGKYYEVKPLKRRAKKYIESTDGIKLLFPI